MLAGSTSTQLSIPRNHHGYILQALQVRLNLKQDTRPRRDLLRLIDNTTRLLIPLKGATVSRLLLHPRDGADHQVEHMQALHHKVAGKAATNKRIEVCTPA